MKYLFYVLTTPLRLLLVFACAAILIAGFCVLQVFEGER